MNTPTRVGFVFGLTFAYAILRYVFFHDVAWANVPLYVLNKSVSWSGVIFFGISLVAREKAHRRYYGTLACATIAAHLIMSVLVLNPQYFAKFYAETGRLNATGEASMLAGMAGALFLGGLFYANLAGSGGSERSLRTGWGRIVLWAAAAHVAIMGYASWISPGAWPGYLPPISLLSLLTALYFLYARGQRT